MAPDQTKISIDGDVIGSQIAVGDHNVQVAENGILINIMAAPARPAFSRRPGPVDFRPRRYSNLLDRISEVEAATSAWASIPVVLHGVAGAGKTSLLNELAHLAQAREFSDGVVYLSVRDIGLDDLRQELFECFYESNLNSKAAEPQILHSLHDIKALILLDDLTLSEDDTSALLDTVPNCACVLVSSGRVLLGKSQTLALGGLPEDEALALFERGLGRPLKEGDKSIAREICKLLSLHPSNILQFAALVREEGKSLEALKTQLTIKTPEDFLVHGSIESLPETHQKILAVLTVAGGAPVPQIHLGALSGSESVQTAVDDLKARGLVQGNDSRYSLVGTLGFSLARTWENLDSWEDSMIDYFAGWLTQNPKAALIEQAQDILVMLIKKAGGKNRWPAVVNLGRGLERFLMLGRRWQSWEEILDLILRAARALGDRKTEGWALHQLGSRALSLGISDQAHQFLTQAMSIRKAIGDKADLAVTQHNMEVLSGSPSNINVKQADEVKRPKTPRRGLNWQTAAVNVILVAAGVGIGGQFFNRTITETVRVPETVVVERTVIARETIVVTRVVTLPPADTTAPPAPRIVAPKDVDAENPLSCDDKIILYWDPVQDQSVPISYKVRLFYFNYYDIGGAMSSYDLGFIGATNKDITSTLAIVCKGLFENQFAKILWTVAAQDGAGNLGDFSHGEFLIRKPVALQ